MTAQVTELVPPHTLQTLTVFLASIFALIPFPILYSLPSIVSIWGVNQKMGNASFFVSLFSTSQTEFWSEHSGLSHHLSTIFHI